jgi:DNA-binding transcriptional LysR family regulator
MTDAPPPSAELDSHPAHDVTRLRAHQPTPCLGVNTDPGRIRIGFTTNVPIEPAVGALRRRHPRAEILLRRLDWWEPHVALLEHRVDAVVARLPFPTDELSVTVIYAEPRVLVVPWGHRLAGRSSVSLDDFVGETLRRLPRPDRVVGAARGATGSMRDDRRAGAHPLPETAFPEPVGDSFELVATGHAIVIALGLCPASLRPDLTTVPLEGVEPSRVVVATRRRDASVLVREFRRCAEALDAPRAVPA